MLGFDLGFALFGAPLLGLGKVFRQGFVKS